MVRIGSRLLRLLEWLAVVFLTLVATVAVLVSTVVTVVPHARSKAMWTALLLSIVSAGAACWIGVRARARGDSDEFGYLLLLVGWSAFGAICALLAIVGV